MEVAVNEIKLHHFSSEASLTLMLLDNIEEFMLKTFNEKVKSATNKKSQINGYFKIKDQTMPKRGLRLDLWVECESGNKYLFEIKNPKESGSVNIEAIGQLLRYATIFPEATNLVILSTVWDEYFDQVVSRFNLPIDFVLLTETQTFLMKKNG